MLIELLLALRKIRKSPEKTALYQSKITLKTQHFLIFLKRTVGISWPELK
jgi:hypothetical protein